MPSPLFVGQGRRLTRSVVPPCFGDGQFPDRRPSLRPVTRAGRNPLLEVHGFWLGGEFGDVSIGSHHPPTLLDDTARLLLLVTAIYGTMLSPLFSLLPASSHTFGSGAGSSVLATPFLPAVLTINPASFSIGPNNAYPAKTTNNMTGGHAVTIISPRIPHTK